MIRCNNCMEVFDNENDLSIIVEQSELIDGDWHTMDRFKYDIEMDLKDTENIRFEIFKGCPYCLADEYLMDVENYKN